MTAARTILIMAGGTGGHIMPGLAVADVLRERGWRVLWLGNPEKMEGRLVPPRGIELVPLRFQGVRGKGASALLKLPFLLLRAFAQAWSRLSDVRPDVVLGMGGYVAFPGGVIAALRGTPLVVHEQNAVAGTANKCLAKMSRRVLSGFPGVLPKGEAMGNPVRADLCALPDPAERYAGRTGPLRHVHPSSDTSPPPRVPKVYQRPSDSVTVEGSWMKTSPASCAVTGADRATKTNAAAARRRLSIGITSHPSGDCGSAARPRRRSARRSRSTLVR